MEPPLPDDIVTLGRLEQLMATLGEVEAHTISKLKRSAKKPGITAADLEAAVRDFTTRRNNVVDEIHSLLLQHRTELFGSDPATECTISTRGGIIALYPAKFVLLLSRTGTKICKALDAESW